MKVNELAQQIRKTQYPVESIFVNRWSPRAMSGEELNDEEFLPLFEAARWAPSSYNNQPWRFIIAKRNTPEWEKLFNLMVDFNQGWTKNAAVLVVIISYNNFEHNGKPSATHSFDTGAAWENFALEGSKRGLVVHGMQGFDYERAKKELSVPEDYTVEAMVAIGHPGNKESLSAELQEREIPSDRKPLEELIFKGMFGNQYLS
jgi:nitroreductase